MIYTLIGSVQSVTTKKKLLNTSSHAQQQKNQMNHIILNNKKKLLDLINQHGQDNKTLNIKLRDIDHTFIWELYYDNQNITFLDILKGIVPSFLFDHIYSKTKHIDVMHKIISI